MARAIANPDIGKYNKPGLIQAPGPRIDDGQGGAAPNWVTVRGGGTLPLMVHLYSANFGRGIKRMYQYGQLYPTVNHWAEFLYASDVAINGSMTLLIGGSRFQILGAIDPDLTQVITLLALIEWQAKGSR